MVKVFEEYVPVVVVVGLGVVVVVVVVVVVGGSEIIHVNKSSY